MTKKLAVEGITSELASGSVFFQQIGTDSSEDDPSLEQADRLASAPESVLENLHASALASTAASTAASSEEHLSLGPDKSMLASTPARMGASTSASSLARMLADSDDLPEGIYRVVKHPGKEIAYVRMTEREKSELTSVLAGIVQDYGYKVSETELIRIAICSLLADHVGRGDEGLLMQVVRELRD